MVKAEGRCLLEGEIVYLGGGCGGRWGTTSRDIHTDAHLTASYQSSLMKPAIRGAWPLNHEGDGDNGRKM